MIQKCKGCGYKIKSTVKSTPGTSRIKVTCPVCGKEQSSVQLKGTLQLIAIGVGLYFLHFVYHLLTSQVKVFL